MFNWTKIGRIFDPTAIGNKPWMQEFAQAPATLIFDDFVRVYFSCRPRRDENGQYVSYSAYLDLDRNNLSRIIAIADKPIMVLGGAGEFDEHGIYPISIIRDNEKVYAYYGGWSRCESVPYNVSIGLAESLDGGKSFKKLGPGPILSHSLEEPMTVSGPKIRKFNGSYYLWYVAGSKWTNSHPRPESIFKIRMATSLDGRNWSKVGKNIIQTVLEDDECQASPDVICIDDQYHMFFCYKFGSDFRGTNRGYRIGYASSADLTSWYRNDASAGISPSNDSSWDGQSVAYPHVFELDGQVYMVYLGNEVGRFGFGLAVLQR